MSELVQPAKLHEFFWNFEKIVWKLNWKNFYRRECLECGAFWLEKKNEFVTWLWFFDSEWFEPSKCASVFWFVWIDMKKNFTMSEIERNNPPTTTISTIAIQSGNTRIVIALLQVLLYNYFVQLAQFLLVWISFALCALR